MGVTNRSKVTYKPSVASSTAASSSESLHLVSDSTAHSDTEQPSTHHVVPRRVFNVLSHAYDLGARNLGRRRAHRLRSIRDLENLSTINEDEEDINMVSCLTRRESPFLKVINNIQFASVWDNFCQSSETEQSILLADSPRHSHSPHNVLAYEYDSQFDDEPKTRLAVNAYRSLNYGTRRRLRKIRNLISLAHLEDMVLEHFYQNKKDSLEKCDLNDYLRFLCCAVAQYYNLTTNIIDSDNGIAILRMQTFNNKPYIHTLERLYIFLQNKRT